MLCSHEWPNDGVNYTASYTALRFRIMQDALSEQNRTILYSLCEWGKRGIGCTLDALLIA
jgi:alpha-galactosidase